MYRIAGESGCSVTTCEFQIFSKSVLGINISAIEILFHRRVAESAERRKKILSELGVSAVRLDPLLDWIALIGQEQLSAMREAVNFIPT